MKDPIKKPKNQANMWSTENSRFCEKYIEKQPKTSQNNLFSAVFWSKRRDFRLRRIFLAFVLGKRAYHGFAWDTTSILLRRVKFSSSTSTKKRRTTVRGCPSLFLVEVWRFELQASSTRNWRATNCATPRKCYKKCLKK